MDEAQSGREEIVVVVFSWVRRSAEENRIIRNRENGK